MSYRVVFRKIANDDLVDIENYLSQFYPGTVKNFFDQLEKQISYINTSPLMYPEYDEDPYFRKMIVGDYLLFYHVDEERSRVIVHHVFHGSRDISKLMQNHQHSCDK